MGSCRDTAQRLLTGYSIGLSLSSGFIFAPIRTGSYAILSAYGTQKQMEDIFFNYVYLKLKVNSRHFYKLLHSQIKCLSAVKLRPQMTLHRHRSGTSASNCANSGALGRNVPDFRALWMVPTKGLYWERNTIGIALHPIRKDNRTTVPLK